jgi:uncharacterized phage protein gp47/JayE
MSALTFRTVRPGYYRAEGTSGNVYDLRRRPEADDEIVDLYVNQKLRGAGFIGYADAHESAQEIENGSAS